MTMTLDMISEENDTLKDNENNHFYTTYLLLVSWNSKWPNKKPVTLIGDFLHFYISYNNKNLEEKHLYILPCNGLF